ncbi:MAG: formate dehydrogenase, partial [Phycisphaerae bacterium SM23_30]
FQKEENGLLINRTNGLACLGGAALDSEECYLYSKFARMLGVTYLEHQARICHSSTVAALAASFGRGAMTNHFVDMVNADVVMVMGSNTAECHPIASRWVQRAQEGIPWTDGRAIKRGARKKAGAVILSADPRFTRTSSFSDHYAQFRSGTDIAFAGGMVNYALQNNRIQRDYLINHTNASFIIREDYNFDVETGLFSGYQPHPENLGGSYIKTSWGYELDADDIPMRDKTLQHPRCVFQLMKKHFSRYDIETVCSITGTPVEDYRRICDIYTSTYLPTRSGTWLYAMGTTQHTSGTQNIRTYAILQMVLGNVGTAGGGINALRGESNVQGSTDHCLLFHILPGYLKSPVPDDTDLAAYIENTAPKTNDPLSANWWQNYPKYIVSQLKAWWGDHAAQDRAGGFCFNYIPKRSGNYSHIGLFEAMDAGIIKGFFILGQNPAVDGPDAKLERNALGKLDWMVAADLWETDTSVFWKRPGVDPKDIQTEVFLLPACSSVEKEGSITNSGRWAQWRYEAVPALGDSHSDAWILDRLVKKLKELYRGGGVFPEPIVNLHWNYDHPDTEHEEPDIKKVAMEINGYEWISDSQAGRQIPSFTGLQADGTTCSGNWLYCGSFVELEDERVKEGPHIVEHSGRMLANRMAKRIADPPPDTPEYDQVCGAGRVVGLNADWTWCWPVNRRILYNRASCNARGVPYNPNRYVIKYDWEAGRWIGDVPDGGWPPLENPDGTPNSASRYSFIMRPDGHGSLFSTSPTDGPFPEHYEPWESPLELSKLQLLGRDKDKGVEYNPVSTVWRPDTRGTPDEFPIVATTFRLCEHWQAGCMTRNLAWLVECFPDPFVEISKHLARRKGIKSGDRVVVKSKRGEMEAWALVTERFQTFRCGDRIVDHIGIPWHFGYAGLDADNRKKRLGGEEIEGSANVLTPHIGDANTTIPEYKAFLCDVTRKEV